MWHVETDYFAMAVFIIMLIKNYLYRKDEKDLQAKAFYYLLIFSILSTSIDIAASVAMNTTSHWWIYQISMTLYVMSMPMLASVWVCYAYVLIFKDLNRTQLHRNLGFILAPYFLYLIVAATNPYTGLFFHLSKDMEYSRGVLFMPVGVGFIMLYSFIGLAIVLFYHKKISSFTNVMLLTTFFAATASFTWIQLANPGWLIIHASYAIVYIWCDITIEDQRRQALYQQISITNKELKEAVATAESATQAKTEFLSRMSHDIRTPMNAIIGLTHLAKDEEDIHIIKEYLYNIESSSDFLLGLINDILDMSKIENGDLKLKNEVFSKEDFTHSIITVIKPLMDNKNIFFDFRLEGTPNYLWTDKLRFNQIFFNLLSNASKFTAPGGCVEFIVTDLPEKDGKIGLHFIVRDNGIGMSPEFLPHMYDPFAQERSSLVDSSKGTGLGLPIVKNLVDAMNGTISVKSQQGVGTEFVIDLYFLPAMEGDTTEQIAPANKESLKGAKILLTEDNEINIYVAKIILERVQCEVTVAKNGQEAINTFLSSQENYFDAILMDIRMPVMDGITATKEIRNAKRKDAATIPIIAMTADAFEDQQKQTLKAGMTYHLSKPIDPPLLYHVLSSYLLKER